VASTAFSQVEQTPFGSLRGLIGEAEINLTEVLAELKPDRYSESCTLSIVNELRNPDAIDIVFLTPCGSVEGMEGMELRPRGSETEYIRVAVDLEFDEQHTGRYRTYWEAAGIRMTEASIILRLTEYDGEYLSGELDSELRLRRLDGSLPSSSRTDRFTATFRARVRESSESASDLQAPVVVDR
jgi:hypothetical protein